MYCARARSRRVCARGSSSCFPMTVRISSISLPISVLARPASACIRLCTTTRPRCCTSARSCRHSRCRISSHCVVCSRYIIIIIVIIIIIISTRHVRSMKKMFQFSFLK
uniref:Uncharacterized protein n=1 Tax=Anolis carolinensis TaxID=28377 RepID=A0A803T1G2_ANOCA